MADRDQGFTLIELLVVIIIIGILAAIAIPVFLNQRKKALDAAVTSDLHNAAISIETWAVDNPGIPVLPAGSSEGRDWQNPGVPGGHLEGLPLSPGNHLLLKPSAGTPIGGWCLFAYNHDAGRATGFPNLAWRSLLGGQDPTLAPNNLCA